MLDINNITEIIKRHILFNTSLPEQPDWVYRMSKYLNHIIKCRTLLSSNCKLYLFFDKDDGLNMVYCVYLPEHKPNLYIDFNFIHLYDLDDYLKYRSNQKVQNLIDMVKSTVMHLNTVVYSKTGKFGYDIVKLNSSFNF